MRLFWIIPLLALGACGAEGASGGSGGGASQRSDAETAALMASLPAPYNEADLDNGRRVFARCRACHTIVEGGANMTGPNLHGVFGRTAGTHDGYAYSRALSGAGFQWDAEKLDHWLENPSTFLPGNRMSFVGVADATDRRDLIAWLKVESGYTPPA